MDLTNFVNGVIKNAAKSSPQEAGDYKENGLLYCGKCNTPKQCRIELFGSERIVPCLCKCRVEKREAERIEQARIEQMRHIQKLRQIGFPDAEMQNWNFDNDDHQNQRITEIAKRYVANFDEMKNRGKGLLFYGPVGTGKTFAAACIANALIDSGRACLVTNFARLVNTIQGMFDGKQEYIDRLNRFDVLVIDDLASERDTEYMTEIVYNIIDSRYRAGLPLIITTNLTSEELGKPAQISKQRIYSRVLEMCVPVEVKGDDRRKMKLRAEYKDLANLLGIKRNGNNEK